MLLRGRRLCGQGEDPGGGVWWCRVSILGVCLKQLVKEGGVGVMGRYGSALFKKKKRGGRYRVKISAQSQSNQPFDWSLNRTIETF